MVAEGPVLGGGAAGSMELYGSLYDNNLAEWQLILPESPCHGIVLPWNV
jgi:hypothetical protein